MRQNAKIMSTEQNNQTIDNVGSANVYCATQDNETKNQPPEYPLHGKTGIVGDRGPGDPFQKNQEKVISEKVTGEVLRADDGYHPSYCQQLIDFFDSKEKYGIITETMVWKTGEVREILKKVANPPPSFRDFAKQIGVKYKQLEKWAQKYPEFLEAFEEAQEIYKDFLIENGLLGKYSGEFTKFVAKNKVGMKDQTESKNLNVNFSITSLLNEIENK